MGFLNEEEKKKIVEEEEVRSQVRRKYEQKSSGIAGVLSTLCPGMGQVYNGQIGKASLFFFCFIVSIAVLCLGIIGVVKKSSPGASFSMASSAGISEEEPVQMSPEGVVAGEVATTETAAAEQPAAPETGKISKEQKAVINSLAMIGLGAVLALFTVLFAISDAIRTARRKNQAA